MRSFRLDRSILFLVAILLVLVVVAVFMFFAMRTDPVGDSLSGDKLLKVLVVLEDGGMPVSTNIIAYYPGSKRAAMFDMWISSTGNGIALMASCSDTPCWVRPAGLSSAPSTVSMF